MDPIFWAEFCGPKRGTQAEAIEDWNGMLECLLQLRPDLVPVVLKHEQVACKGVNWRDRG